MTATSTQSKKSKGRSFQQFCVKKFLDLYSFLTEDDIMSRSMGAQGTDIILSAAAKKVIPFDIECKRTEKLNFATAFKQAQSNTTKGRIPLLISKRNYEEALVTLTLDDFLKLIKK